MLGGFGFGEAWRRERGLTIGEIEGAVDIIRSEGNENIIIHQCPSGYPARLESINLRIIQTLKQMFPYPVAFSDHTPGDEMDIAAIALGANVIEKTITEDRMTRSVEHVMSLEPNDMKSFVKTIREVEIGLGERRRIIKNDEIIKRDEIRRSVYLKSNTKAGTRLGDCSIEFRRPGYGITPVRYEELINARMKSDLLAGHRLELTDLIWV